MPYILSKKKRRLRTIVVGGGYGSTPVPPTGEWILQNGVWNDSGVWKDDAVWKDDP